MSGINGEWVSPAKKMNEAIVFEQPPHIHDLLRQMKNFHRYSDTFNVFSWRTEYLKNTFFPHAINDCNKLVPNICNSSSDKFFRNVLPNFIRAVERKIFNINDPFRMKMLIRLRLAFSLLCKYEFRLGFQDL